MEVSAELRWFWEIDVPPAFKDWFLNSPVHPFPAGGKQRRNDVYIFDPDQVELGIKVRGDRPGLQVKGLVARTGHLSEGPFRGDVEIWTKWTSEKLTLPAATILASKTRWLRKFETREGAPREIQLNADAKPIHEEPPDNGCHVELTMVETNNKLAWTFGFEAFGQLASVSAQLRAVAAAMAARQPPDFGNPRLQSYPVWLSILKRSEGLRAPSQR
jgi:hypothetical protein